MSRVEIDYLGEGASDEEIARRLILAASATPGISYLRPRTGTGKNNVDQRLNGLNLGAAYGRPILVLRDLDQDARCAGALVKAKLPNRHPNLIFRICIPTAEAWLLADEQAFAPYSGLSRKRIPTELEAMPNPKRTLLDWAEQGFARKLKTKLDEGRSRGLVEWQILGAWLAEFAQTRWDPVRAAESGRVPSLTRALERLQALSGSKA